MLLQINGNIYINNIKNKNNRVKLFKLSMWNKVFINDTMIL